MILLDLFTFSGRLHPMVVHLPIGFLLLGAAFHVLSYFPNYRHLRSAVSLILFIGFLSAVAACILGYVLSLSGEYDTHTLNNHKWAGIFLALVSGLLWSMTTSFYSKFLSIPATAVSVLCVVVIGLLAYTGHQGANLTHGSEYLSLETLTHQEREKPTKAEEAMIFEDVVQPLLEKRCEGCHNKGKRKGELTVTSWEELMKGGKHGAVIVAGKPEESELYRRITLDREHEDFMPTDGKTPLTKTETKLIHWWIEKAQAAQGKKLADLSGNEAILPIAATILELPGALPSPEAGVQNVNPSIPVTLNMALVEKLREKGLTVRVMLHQPVMLDVTLPAQSGVSMKEIQNELGAVAKNVVWLNLSDNDLKEDDLAVLKQMTNLEKLRLEKNPVTDGIGDLLANMKYLQAVNLNETQLSDSGLARLQQHPSLKRIYSWKTAVR